MSGLPGGPRPSHPGRALVRPVTLCVLALTSAACGAGVGPDRPPDPPQDTTRSATVDVTIAPDQDRTPISPYIYGSNQDFAGNAWTVRRLGGNRLTGYNWENNFSNAGSDWQQSSDRYLLSSAGLTDAVGPAGVVTHFHDQSLAMGAASIVTLQMAGYVSADANGTVQLSETAPSPRWARVQPSKSAAFTLTPSTADSVVYMDELVNLLLTRYGAAGTARGVRWYSLDNEPGLWSSTHPRIHPARTGARELVDRSVALASAVKAVDPQAGVLGPALYGFNAFLSLQDAPDWPQVGGGSRWFVDYYLAALRGAGQTAGTRLLDVLDVHWYPEAQGDHRITDDAATTPNDEDARLQAPRTLWDSTYVENSWIGQYYREYLPLLPSLSSSIERQYPGTRLAITEYSYGGGNTISGGLAQADVLGIFGRSGVYLATLWGIRATDVYIAGAFRLYRDYDGGQGAYGGTAVHARTGDVEKSSAYASIEAPDAARLHLILINKTRASLAFRVSIAGSRTYSAGSVWGFDPSGATIRPWPAPGVIAGNAFTYIMPALSAAHLVLR